MPLGKSLSLSEPPFLTCMRKAQSAAAQVCNEAWSLGQEGFSERQLPHLPSQVRQGGRECAAWGPPSLQLPWAESGIKEHLSQKKRVAVRQGMRAVEQTWSNSSEASKSSSGQARWVPPPA